MALISLTLGYCLMMSVVAYIATQGHKESALGSMDPLTLLAASAFWPLTFAIATITYIVRKEFHGRS